MKKELNGVIYKITSPNNKVYIGQTINYLQRCRKYKYRSFKGQRMLWNNCEKYNWNPNDHIEIIELCLQEILDEREIYWINEYDSFNNGLNLSEGGKSRKGFKHTQKTKDKLRELNIGNKHSEETKRKISEIQKTRNPDINKRIGISHIGKTHSDETKLKISKANTGKTHSDETKLKISKANIGNTKMLGKTHSNKTKLKISKTKKGIPNVKSSIKIICTTTGEIFNSQNEAADKMNLHQPSISRVCTKVRKQYKGFTFMFYNEYLNNKKDK